MFSTYMQTHQLHYVSKTSCDLRQQINYAHEQVEHFLVDSGRPASLPADPGHAHNIHT